jgi:predicted RNA-binding Zn-ribbon protein involved in translation (DUF1610 family)
VQDLVGAGVEGDEAGGHLGGMAPRRAVARRAAAASATCGLAAPVFNGLMAAGWTVVPGDDPETPAQLECPTCGAVVVAKRAATHGNTAACKRAAQQLKAIQVTRPRCALQRLSHLVVWLTRPPARTTDRRRGRRWRRWDR